VQGGEPGNEASLELTWLFLSLTRHFSDLATSVFRTRDLMDIEYLALLIPSLAQLW